MIGGTREQHYNNTIIIIIIIIIVRVFLDKGQGQY